MPSIVGVNISVAVHIQACFLDIVSLWDCLLAQELDHVVEELEKIAVVNLLQHRSIISLVGNVQRSSLILEKVSLCTCMCWKANIKNGNFSRRQFTCQCSIFFICFFSFACLLRLVLFQVFNVLRTNGVNVQMISQGASKVLFPLIVSIHIGAIWSIQWVSNKYWILAPKQVNISLIVNDDEAERCVKALHFSFFESGDLSETDLDDGFSNGKFSAFKVESRWP